MAKIPDVGQAAPDFTLSGVVVADGQATQGEYSLSQQRGKPLVLAFYPGDNTAVCTRQLCSYTSGLESFTDFGATVWAIRRTGSRWAALACGGRCSSSTPAASCAGST